MIVGLEVEFLVVIGISLGLLIDLQGLHVNGESTSKTNDKDSSRPKPKSNKPSPEFEKLEDSSVTHRPIEVLVDKKKNEENSKKVLVPSDHWQEVKPYHELPPGLHIRINLQTGLKEAKILSKAEEKRVSVSNVQDDAFSNKNEIAESEKFDKREQLFRENIIEALKNIKNEDIESEKESKNEDEVSMKRKKKKFRSYDVLKEQFQELKLNIESESEIMNRLMKEFENSDDGLKLTIIEDMDFLIHQIDVAVNFVNMGGLKKIIEPGLNSTNEEVRKGVMRLLGSASQSNPKVQIAALEEGLLNQLLRVVARETDAAISSKAVFAVSCLVRGFPYGQRRLVESGGLHTLREVFLRQDWQSLTLQLKVVSLIQDLLEERESAEGDRLKQLRQLDLGKWLVEGEWCSAILSLLKGVSFDRRGKRDDLSAALGKGVPLRPDHDTVDRVVSAMTLLSPSCDNSFFPSLPLLRSLKEAYSDLAYKETFQGEDGHEFFQDLADQIQFLVMKISRKEEL